MKPKRRAKEREREREKIINEKGRTQQRTMMHDDFTRSLAYSLARLFFRSYIWLEDNQPDYHHSKPSLDYN
jgi:hypothetical protein